MIGYILTKKVITNNAPASDPASIAHSSQLGKYVIKLVGTFCIGKNGCNNVGVTIIYLLNHAPTTTIIPTINIGSGFLPFLKTRTKMGIIIPTKIANQNMGA